MLRVVAGKLGPLLDQAVFLGGATVSLFITDPAFDAFRPTDDVDIIVAASSLASYYRFTDELKDRGFRADTSDDAPICRWKIDGVRVDVMTTDPFVLGLTPHQSI